MRSNSDIQEVPFDLKHKRSRSQSLLNALNDKNDIGILLRNATADMRSMNINEFFGFNLETRIRQLVCDCVEPLRIHHEQTINRVKASEDRIRKNGQQIGEVGFIMQKTLQRSSSLEEVHQQILLMENERKVSESSIIAEVNQIRQLLRESHEKVISIDEIIRSDRRLHKMLKTDMNHMRNDINTFKDKISDDHVKFKLDFQNKQDKFYHEVNKVQEQLQIMSVKMKNNQESLIKHETIIDQYRNNMQELYDTVNDLNEKKMGKNTYEAELTQIRRDLINLKFKNEDTYQSLLMTDNYIDRYLRVDILNEIFEALFSTSSDAEQIEKIVDLAKSKYQTLLAKIKDAEQAEKLKNQQASPEKKNQAPKLFNLVNQIKQAQQTQQPIFVEAFNKVAYKMPQFERIDSKEGEPLISMKYDFFNGMKGINEPLTRQINDFDILRKKIILTQKAMAQISSPFKRPLNRNNSNTNTNQGLNIKSLADQQDSIEEQYEDIEDAEFDDGKTINEQKSDTKSMGSAIFFNHDLITSPRAGPRGRKLNKRPTFKKIIVNASSAVNSKTIIELQEQTQNINNELVKNEGKHKHHQEKISVLEDLDDELKEIVLQSQEQIEMIFDKMEELDKKASQISQYTSEQDTKILKMTEDAINLQKTQIENMQKDLEEDFTRRIREKSNFDLAMKKVETEIASLIEKEKKSEEVIGMIMETIRMVFQNSRILTTLIKQDEIDKQSIQLLGVKMNSEQSNLQRQKSKKSIPNINSQITGISIDNSDELNGGMSLHSGVNHPSRSVISIDKNCFSCSGQQNVVMNAFKMACLQYQPQRVTLGNETYERFELIEQSVKSLEKMNQSPFMQSLNQISFVNQNSIHMPLLKDNLLNFSNQNIREQDSVQIVRLDKWTTQTEEDHFNQNLNRSKSSTPKNNIKVVQRSTNELPNLPTQVNKIKQNINEYISNRNLPELKKLNESYNNTLFKTLAQPKTARQLSRNLVLPSFNNLQREGIATVQGDGSQVRSTNLLQQQYSQYSTMTQQKKKRGEKNFNPSLKSTSETKSNVRTPPPLNRNITSAQTMDLNSNLNGNQYVPIMQNVIMQKALQRQQKQVKVPEIMASQTLISMNRPDTNPISQ